MKSHNFTLTELVAVIAIMLIVGGLVAGRIGRVPAFASLENAVGEVERMFNYASYLAVTRGKTVAIVYNPSNREFRLAEVATEEEIDNSTRKYLNEKYGTVTLNSGIEFAFENVASNEKIPEYRCFSDGSASGPPMKFSLNKHVMRIRLSPLTGAVTREDVSGE